MKTSIPRLHSVRPKAGGASIHLLRQEQGDDDFRRTMVRHARMIAGFEGDMAGFAVVAIYKDGGHSLGWRVDDNGPIGATMLPSIIRDLLLRDIIVVQEGLDQ